MPGKTADLLLAYMMVITSFSKPESKLCFHRTMANEDPDSFRSCRGGLMRFIL